jgi:hypothetical protein
MKGFTTTDMLPDPVRAQYEMTKPLEGGPRFNLPHYGGDVDFSAITVQQAAALVRLKCPYIRLKTLAAKKVDPEPPK